MTQLAFANHKAVLLDCTLRDGGYYNDWDFSPDLINDYLEAMQAAGIDVVELGFRFWSNEGFKGACAFTKDEFLRDLQIPFGLQIAVMVNAADVIVNGNLSLERLEKLFPESATTSPVSLVRFACHFKDFHIVLSAAEWLVSNGYQVAMNLMQIADRTKEEITQVAQAAAHHPLTALYFADSMGSMRPADTSRIISWVRTGWSGPLGIHTHDNMGLALQNTLHAHEEGVTWLDATVTGMGRGPGNARMEDLLIEAATRRNRVTNLVPLMTLIRRRFNPMKAHYGWGTNPYYYLAGKHGIHPTYIQEMLKDSRYGDEDILAVIDHLREEGGKKFSFNTLDGARRFYRGEPRGTWAPSRLMEGREIMILGTGPGAAAHRPALETYIRHARPLVLALNTQSAVAEDLIDVRVACHPVRLLADAERHAQLPQPLITPASMLPERLLAKLAGKELLDFGLGLASGQFAFHKTYCITPTALVLAYALAASSSGGAARICMAGFDGYPAGDPRNTEIETMLESFTRAGDLPEFFSVTPTSYKGLPVRSIYGL